MRPPMIQSSFNCYHDNALWFTLAYMIMPYFTLTMSCLNQHLPFWPRSDLISYLIIVSAGCNFTLWKWSEKAHFKLYILCNMFSWCITGVFTADGLTLQTAVKAESIELWRRSWLIRRIGSARSQTSADASGSKTKLAAALSKLRHQACWHTITGFTTLSSASVQKNKDYSWPDWNNDTTVNRTILLTSLF